MQGYPPPYPPRPLPPYPPQPPAFVAPRPRMRPYTVAIVMGALTLFSLVGALICLGFAFNYAQIPASTQIACALGAQDACQQLQAANTYHAIAIAGALGCGVVSLAFGGLAIYATVNAM